MCNGNAEGIGAHIQQGRLENGTDDGEYSQPDNGTNDIEGQVHKSRPSGVFGSADGGKHGSDAGADVLTHDNGDGSAIADRTGDGQRLQDTYGSGAGLDDGGEYRTGQRAENRILEHEEQLLELGNILKTGNGIGHSVHAEHQRGKAQKDHAGVFLFAVFQENVEDHTDQRQHGGEGGRLQKLNKQAVAVDGAKAQDPCGDGGTNIGTHDHIDGLSQLQKTGVYEADHHDSGGGRTLDHGGDGHAGKKTGKLIGGQLAQQGTQAVTCPALQCLAHNVHAEQEQTQATDHSQ